MAIIERLTKAWNAFRSIDPIIVSQVTQSGGSVSYGGQPPQRQPVRYVNERSIVSSIYTRISIDVAGVGIRHVNLDDKGRYASDSDSGFNDCLLFKPNLDQGPRQFRQDVISSLFDEGVAVIVPVDTTVDPTLNATFDINSMRVGKVVAWYPRNVRVSVYNDSKGCREEVILEKRYVAIIENPLYSVMNAPNSTLQRLTRKLHILDAIDEQSGSGKLDLIIQLPYVIKSEARRLQAQQRKEDIEFQLKGSQYGIAYTDGTEKITQLNRPAENNLLGQIEFLTKMLYGQLGITEEVMNGNADEKTMLHYYNRTVEPLLDAVVEGMQMAFLGMIGIRNKERVMYFRDPFKLVPMADIAEIADKFSRNEILSPNEIRGFMGLPPSSDPKSDQLVNSNMPQPALNAPPPPAGPTVDDMTGIMNKVFDQLGSSIDKLGK